MLFKLTDRMNFIFHESVGAKGSKKGHDGGYTNPQNISLPWNLRPLNLGCVTLVLWVRVPFLSSEQMEG